MSEGLRITLEALGRAAARCTDRCRLVVVVIPTKELVFAERLRETGATAPAAFERLVANEREVRERLGRFLVGAGIAWIDTLAVLRAAVEAGDNPYPADWNAHPNARGNDAIARGVATSLAATTAPTLSRAGSRGRAAARGRLR